MGTYNHWMNKFLSTSSESLFIVLHIYTSWASLQIKQGESALHNNTKMQNTTQLVCLWDFEKKAEEMVDLKTRDFWGNGEDQQQTISKNTEEFKRWDFIAWLLNLIQTQKDSASDFPEVVFGKNKEMS